MKFILFLSLICVLLTICSTDVLEENIENEEEEAKISKFTVYTFYYIISLLPAHISFSCVDSILFLPGVKRLIGMLGLVVDTASSITSAIEVFNELKVESKILVSLKNYCKWSVSVVSIEIIQGVTRSGMASLPAGEEGGWTASQDEGLFADVGTEGYAA